MAAKNIELKRKSLIKTAMKYGLNAKETITCSQELDLLLLHEIKWRNTIITKNKLNNNN